MRQPRRVPFLLLAALLAALSACAAARTVPEGDRHSLARAWEGKIVYLRSSLHVMPFFADGTRRLVSPLHPDSILLLTDTRGAPIAPGEVEALLPLGTKVRVEKLEFPTGLMVTRRPLYTPRENPWVYLSLPGAPRGRPYVAVLRSAMTTREDFLAALGDLFSEDEPALWLKNASPEVRQAIEQKRLLVGMSSEQVLLSWGRPERIQQDLLPSGVRLETWAWPLGARSAVFRDGKLASAVPALEKAAR